MNEVDLFKYWVEILNFIDFARSFVGTATQWNCIIESFPTLLASCCSKFLIPCCFPIINGAPQVVTRPIKSFDNDKPRSLIAVITASHKLMPLAMLSIALEFFGNFKFVINSTYENFEQTSRPDISAFVQSQKTRQKILHFCK